MTKNNLKTILLLAIGTLWASIGQAQESSNSSGGDATGSGGSVAFSVGQINYTSIAGGAGSVDQGIQHAYEIFTISIKETELNISLIAFPNPTAEHLTLQIVDYNNEKLLYQLFDMQGNQLSNGRIVATQTQLSMNNLPNATYYVNITNQEKKIVQSFKIIKN